MKYKRIKFEEKIKKFSDYNLEGCLDDVILYLQTFQEDYRDQYEELKLRKEYGYEYTEYELWGVRDETDAEYNERVAKEKSNQKIVLERNRQKELAEYERLKKKFEKSK